MKYNFILKLVKDSRILLSFILFIFFLKGFFLVSAFPIFSGQDESRHYNSIQFLSEPKEKNWEITPFEQLQKQEKDSIDTYRYSDEIKQTSLATNTNILRGEMFNTIVFSNNYNGVNENQVNEHSWDPYNKSQYPDVVEGSLYHKIGSLIEKALSNQSILVRFYLIRILSVLFGTLVVLITYLITKNVGLSAKHSLLIAAIVSFQPKVTTYFTNINYDVLFIPMFVFFTYAGILIVKRGINWKNLGLLILSVVIAILAKKTGSILLVSTGLLLAWQFWPKFRKANKYVRYSFFAAAGILGLLILFYLDKYIPAKATFFSIGNYLNKSLSIGRFALSSRTYWGSLSWVNNPIIDQLTNIIWFIQAFSFFGLGLYFFSKQPKPSYLPEKKYIIFLIGMIVALQLGIRTADWSIYSQTGSLDLGTPGRYFLPNIVAHMILVFTGLGMFFEWLQTKRKNISAQKLFDFSLKLSLVLMLSLTMYLIFNEVIYRYYL